MLYRAFPFILLTLPFLPACGSEDGAPGNFVSVYGSQKRSFSLLDGITPSCKKTPCKKVTSSCSCTCDCVGCTTRVDCKQGCVSNCDLMCGSACLTEPNCGGKMNSSSGDCPAKSLSCEGSGLELEAATAPGTDAGRFFRFTIAQLTSAESQSVTMDFGKDGLSHKVEVGFPADGGAAYKYAYGYSTRTEVQKNYNTQCTATVDQHSAGGKRFYSGSMSCIMLWATDKSKDYTSSPLNAHVDLFSRFECETVDTAQ